MVDSLSAVPFSLSIHLSSETSRTKRKLHPAFQGFRIVTSFHPVPPLATSSRTLMLRFRDLLIEGGCQPLVSIPNRFVFGQRYRESIVGVHAGAETVPNESQNHSVPRCRVP